MSQSTSTGTKPARPSASQDSSVPTARRASATSTSRTRRWELPQKDLFLSYRRKGHLAKYANLEPTRNLPAFPQGEPAREPDGEAKQGKDRDRTPPARYWPNSRRPIALSRLHSGQPTGRSGSWCPGRGGLNCPKSLSVRDNQGARKLQSPFVDREMPNSRIRAKRPVPASQSGFGTAHMAFDTTGHETGVGRLQGAMVR